MATVKRKLKSLVFVTLSGIGAYGIIGYYKNDPHFYRHVLMPALHLLDPERAHRLGVYSASQHSLIPKSQYRDSDTLKVSMFGRELTNPVGIAAGFDKNGEAIIGLSKYGFGFIEIGSVTPEPQDGNEKPRVFRLKEDKAVINRYGFNSEGHESVLQRVQEVKQSHKDIIVGVNLGKNKTSDDPIRDYVLGVRKFGPVADYLVINVSSPNTPGLRSMQHKDSLRDLLSEVLRAREGNSPPIFLKLAPDLGYEDMKDIAEVVLNKSTRVDGLIISNTTIDRPRTLRNEVWKNEIGGLSGKPLQEVSTRQIAQMYRFTKGQIPIIGVGGIFTGEDAYRKIKAGASVVQLYTGLIYEGPPIVATVKKELDHLISRDGFKNIAEAVGSDI